MCIRDSLKTKKLLNTLVVAAMMFPVFATIIPVFRMEFSWGIVNTDKVSLSLISLILPQIAGNLAFAMVVLTGYIRSLPIELEESAYLEGCLSLIHISRLVHQQVLTHTTYHVLCDGTQPAIRHDGDSQP